MNRESTSYLSDMDGVLVRGNVPIPGDVNGPSSTGIVPATGAVAALIATATGIQPYFIGKPNPLMMRTALNTIDAHSETSTMIGDNMETDIIAGMETILVLTGVTRREDVERFSFRPTRIVDSIADIVP